MFSYSTPTQAAEFAVEAISNQSNSGSKLDLIKIQSAEKQVVAGLNYQLVLEVANDKQKKQIFEAKVYQPLGNQPLELSAFKELPSVDAHRKAEEGKERSSPALLGAAQEVAPTDPEVVEAANFAVEQLSQQSNSLFPFKLVEVLEAKSKVTNGKEFDMKLKLSQGELPESIVHTKVTRSVPQNALKLQSHETVSTAKA
eukprot:jgi/Astpho2/2978/Aster-x0140